LGDTFSAADAYLAWVFVLADNAGIDPSGYVHLSNYKSRVRARPLISNLIEQDRRKRAAMYKK